MDHRKIPQNPYFQPPENPLTHLYRRSFPTQNHPQTQTPLMITRTPDESEIESLFSRLHLSQTTPFIGVPGTPRGASVPSLAFGEIQQELLFLGQQQQNQRSNNGGVNGPHPNLNVGPAQMGFLDEGPFIDSPLKLMSYQRQDFGGNYDNYSLHGKYGHFPNLPSPHTNSVYRSGVANNQYFHQFQQQLLLENTRDSLVSPVGSGVLNLKLDEGWSNDEIEIALSDVIESLCDLMKNQFGSHYVQRLFVMCNEDQKTRIIMALCKFPFKLVDICLISYGARAIQKLLEKLITPQQISFLVSALSHGVYALATDPNGYHVIQYCVKHFHGEYNRHLFNEIAENCFRIATSKSGCCVVQACVEHSHGEARDLLIGHIIENAVPLAEDPYGNYVVQHLLGMKTPTVTVELLRQFQGHFVSMSCNKYASNVVEKFFVESGEIYSAKVVMELLRSPKVSMLLLDPYGNFVIQSALSESKGYVRSALLNLIQENALSMQTNLYGKKILAWFEKRNLHNA